jgi:hypothetical protein
VATGRITQRGGKRVGDPWSRRSMSRGSIPVVLFIKASKEVHGHTQPAVPRNRWAAPPSVKRPRHEANHSRPPPPKLVPRYAMRDCLYVFMLGRGQLNFTCYPQARTPACCHRIQVYSSSCTTIRYNNIQTYGKTPTCFGLFRPSSGRYSTKTNTIMASDLTDVQ